MTYECKMSTEMMNCLIVNIVMIVPGGNSWSRTPLKQRTMGHWRLKSVCAGAKRKSSDLFLRRTHLSSECRKQGDSYRQIRNDRVETKSLDYWLAFFLVKISMIPAGFVRLPCESLILAKRMLPR